MKPPTLYDLDINLANACWLITNTLLLLPLLIALTRICNLLKIENVAIICYATKLCAYRTGK